MVVFRSAVAVCAIALFGQQALAGNVGGGTVAESVETGNYMAKAGSCSKASKSPEQKAQRSATKGQKTPKTPEQKAQAAARRAATCGTIQPT